jgi:hypothetical protein
VNTWFHVSSAANRESIRMHGLDWTRMGAARGIAGSTVPEADGVFLCQDFMVEFFVGINNTGGPVDVWAVSGIDEEQMLDNGSGFFYFPGRIPAGEVTLFDSAAADVANAPTERRVKRSGGGSSHGLAGPWRLPLARAGKRLSGFGAEGEHHAVAVGGVAHRHGRA